MLGSRVSWRLILTKRSGFTTSSSHSATVLAMGSVQRVNKPPKDAAAEAEAVRLHRLREDAQRPMSVNLAETIALSHALLKMAAPAQRQ